MQPGGGFPFSTAERKAAIDEVALPLHRELASLAFKCRDLHLIFGDDAGFPFFIIQFTAIELRHSQLDEVGGNKIYTLRIAPPDDAVSDILAKLQVKRRRMPSIWTSKSYEPSPSEARRVYQVFSVR